jgi:predicted amidophosphoribosyltransferase
MRCQNCNRPSLGYRLCTVCRPTVKRQDFYECKDCHGRRAFYARRCRSCYLNLSTAEKREVNVVKPSNIWTAKFEQSPVTSEFTAAMGQMGLLRKGKQAA